MIGGGDRYREVPRGVHRGRTPAPIHPDHLEGIGHLNGVGPRKEHAGARQLERNEARREAICERHRIAGHGESLRVESNGHQSPDLCVYQCPILDIPRVGHPVEQQGASLRAGFIRPQVSDAIPRAPHVQDVRRSRHLPHDDRACRVVGDEGCGRTAARPHDGHGELTRGLRIRDRPVLQPRHTERAVHVHRTDRDRRSTIDGHLQQPGADSERDLRSVGREGEPLCRRSAFDRRRRPRFPPLDPELRAIRLSTLWATKHDERTVWRRDRYRIVGQFTRDIGELQRVSGKWWGRLRAEPAPRGYGDRDQRDRGTQ